MELMKVGSKCWYSGGWGADDRVRAVIVEADMDIKNGRPGYCVEVVDADEKPIADEWERCKWGYANQCTPR